MSEDLRERLIAVIKSVRIHPKLDPTVTAMIMAGVGFHVTDDEAAPLADAIIAALAGDPGDLPARMVEAMRLAAVEGRLPATREPLPFASIADVALSVRWEHAASQAAEVERLRAIITTLDCATAERDAATRRRDQAENRASLYRQQVADLKTEWDGAEAQVERLQEIERVTAPPADELEMPADPAELREMWEFINRQSRWQWHMAHKFGEQVERLRAELAEARAAAEQFAAEGNQDLARFTQYREWTHEVVAERDALQAKVATFERALSWETSCTGCADRLTALAGLDELKAAVERIWSDCTDRLGYGQATAEARIFSNGERAQAERVLNILDRALAAPESNGDRANSKEILSGSQASETTPDAPRRGTDHER